MKKLRDHGIDRENKRMYFHDIVGFNYRMTNLQAAIGLAQMERIEALLEKRNHIEELYRNFLGNAKNIEAQKHLSGHTKVCWLVSFLTSKHKAETYIAELKKQHIDARPFFYPLHMMEIYKQFSSHPCPVSEKLSDYGINFPTYTSLIKDDVENICTKIKGLLETL
jgi:perosamine synthetase